MATKKTVRYYHGGNPVGATGPLWFSSHLSVAEGWASRSPSMGIWYVDVPEDHPARGEGDLRLGIPYPSNVELPASLANKRKKLSGTGKSKRETQQKLPKELFDVLLKEGDIGTLLAEGGKDLTKAQLKQVEDLAKEQSKRKMQNMAKGLEGTTGYDNFMNNPIIAGILSKKAKQTTKNQSATKKAAPATAAKQKPSTKKEKSPEISTVPPNTVQPLKKGDSVADILAKMLNLYKEEHDNDIKRHQEYQLKKKDIQAERDKEFEELMKAFKGEDQPKEEKKAEPVKKKSKFLKFALIGGAGLLLSQKSFAGEVDSTTKDFSTSIKVMLDGLYKSLGFAKEGPQPNVDFSGTEGDAKRAAEKYLGKSISAKEWDELLRATAAEASMNQKEEALVMGSILNRARDIGGGEGSIHSVLTAPRQFQSVTGTIHDPGPSEKYMKGPGEKEKASILAGAVEDLGRVRRDQRDFLAASKGAYKKGTNLKRRDEMIAKGGVVVGGSIFLKGFEPDANAVAQETAKPLPASLKKEKPKVKSVIVVQNTTNNAIQGGLNISTVRVAESDKSPAIDQQFYRR